MRHKPGHGKPKRKLLKARRPLLNGTVCRNRVDALMQVAGATGGAFYGHFSSKSELSLR